MYCFFLKSGDVASPEVTDQTGTPPHSGSSSALGRAKGIFVEDVRELSAASRINRAYLMMDSD